MLTLLQTESLSFEEEDAKTVDSDEVQEKEVRDYEEERVHVGWNERKTVSC